MIPGPSTKKLENKRPIKDKTTPKASSDLQKKNVVSNALKKTEHPMKRTMSVQNVGSPKPTLSTPVPGTSSFRQNVKRALSSQNVSGPKTGSKQQALRLSTPVNAMAYNAELLANFEKEKKSLERRISELIQVAENRQRDNEKLKYEVKNLKQKLKNARTLLKDQQNGQQLQAQQQQAQQLGPHESSCVEELTLLKKENSLLKQRLSEVNVCLDEHFTDNEKILMIKKSNDVKSDPEDTSANACQAAKNRSPSDADSKDADCPDYAGSSCAEKRSTYSLECNCWERQSIKSNSEGALSEVSVACLQDRILQMEETHYSTNEELQATLQELTDLQDAVNELTSENERLANERNVLLESLCTQTLKLETTRLHLNFVKSLLLRDGEWVAADVERQLMALMKSDQEEREEMLLRQVELSNKLHATEREGQELQEYAEMVQSKMQSCQREYEELLADKQDFEAQNAVLLEQLGHAQLELEKCNIVVENEQKKISEMEQERRLLLEKNEVTKVVDLLRDEKEKLETKVVSLEQELSEKRFENIHLQQTCAELEEELGSNFRVDAKLLAEKCSEMEVQLQRSMCQSADLEAELKVVHQHLDALRMECEQHLDDKKTHTLTLARAESELRIWKAKSSRAESEVKELKVKFQREQEEWLQFQEDLQRAVVIANEFKTEAQNDAERVASDYQRMQERVQFLSKQLDLSKAEIEHLKQQLTATNQLQKEQQEQSTAAAVQKSLSGVVMEPPPSSYNISRDEIRDKVLSSVDRELASRRQVRQQNQKLSVKHLISSIEEQMKTDSTSTLLCSASPTPSAVIHSGKFSPSISGGGLRKEERILPSAKGSKSPGSPPAGSSGVLKKISPLTSRMTPGSSQNHHKRANEMNPVTSKDLSALSPAHHQHFQSLSLDILQAPTATDDAKMAAVDSVSSSSSSSVGDTSRKPLMSILTNKPKKGDVSEGSPEKSSGHLSYLTKTDPLANLAKQLGGSKRNALLKWCQNKTASYKDIDITNFSSSWNDGLAFCALLHTYMPDKVPYKELTPLDKVRNFTIAFKGAESVGISPTLNIIEMATRERPDWQAVMAYVTSIYKHFELTN